jgi:hypothetical protein
MVIFRGDEEGLFACLLKFLKVKVREEGEKEGKKQRERRGRGEVFLREM